MKLMANIDGPPGGGPSLLYIMVLLLSTFMINMQTVSSKDVDGNCASNLDIVFIVDSSGSIKDADPGNWDVVLNFINAIVETQSISENEVRVGLIIYSLRAEVQFDLNTYTDKESLKTAIL